MNKAGFETVNPATGEEIETFSYFTPAQTEEVVARDLYTGGVFINGFSASDPRVPVGGVKNSGYGRELSHFGAHAFVNAQTVWIETSSP